MCRLIIALSLSIISLRSFCGDGTLPLKYHPFFPATFFSDSVLIIPNNHYSPQVINELIEQIYQAGFQIFVTSDERYNFSQQYFGDQIITIPVSFNGVVRDHTMPTFVRGKKNGEWAIVENSVSIASKELNSWFAEHFNISIIPERKYDIKNKLIVDDNSNCLTIEQEIPANVLKTTFECRRIVRFSCRTLNCNINEHVVILKNKTVVTTNSIFAYGMKKIGYKHVYVVPQFKGESLTDVLILGDHLFFVYNENNLMNMRRVQRIYTRSGYVVHPIRSTRSLCSGIHSVADAIPSI